MDRNEFLKTLDFIKPGLKSNALVEESEMVIFGADRIYSYNDEVAVSCPFETGLEGAIHSKELRGLLTKLKENEIEVKKKTDEFVFQCGKLEAGFKLIEDISPPPLKIDEIKQWRKLPDNFLDALAFCEFSASQNSGMGVLTCVRVGGKEAWSCDNFRITRFEMSSALAKGVLVYIPRAHVSAIIAHVPKKMAQVDSWIHFINADDTVFSCRTMDGEFPPVEGLIGEKGATVKFPAGIHEILGRTETLLDQSEIEVEKLVEITVKKNKITCKGEGPAGWVTEHEKIKYTGKELHFFHNGKMLSQVLSLTQEATIGEKYLSFNGDNFDHVMIHLGEK